MCYHTKTTKSSLGAHSFCRFGHVTAHLTSAAYSINKVFSIYSSVRLCNTIITAKKKENLLHSTILMTIRYTSFVFLEAIWICLKTCMKQKLSFEEMHFLRQKLLFQLSSLCRETDTVGI